MQYSNFQDYDVYMAKATVLAEKGRKSGGVLLFIKKCLSPFISHVPLRFENIVAVEISKSLVGCSKDVLLICAYLPPQDSRFWNISENGFGIEVLEECMIDLYEKKGDCYFMVCGDLNARTGNENYKGEVECLEDITVGGDSSNVIESEERNIYARRSDDTELNMFGRQLLEVCEMLQCIILNGMCAKGFDDSLTYVSSTGGSVIDYFLASCDLFEESMIHDFRVCSVIYSTHFPISIKLGADSKEKNYTNAVKQHEGARQIEKLKWDANKEDRFKEAWNSEEIKKEFQQACSSVESNVERAIEELTQCFLNASKCMKITIYKNNGKYMPKWFDSECKVTKRNVRIKLSNFRKTKKEEDRMDYVKNRKEYKLLIKQKKSGYNKDKARQLASLKNQPRQFWREVKELTGNRSSSTSNNISTMQWFEYFSNLFQVEAIHSVQDISTELNTTELDIHDRDIEEEITENEVRAAVGNMKNGKAQGVDGITPEMVKAGGEKVIQILKDIFNNIFFKGLYPDSWSKAIIVPIYKKGNKNLVDNYRGVSLLSILSKCYTYILNKRLVKWTKNKNLVVEEQAGFRRGYSTTDHIFTLNAIVQKCLSKKGGKLYVCFIDLRKAFDSVSRDLLFNMLEERGLKGNFMNSIRAIYKSVKSCVRANNELSEFFECPVGLRQGCMLSPILFSLFINQVATYINVNGKHGIQLMPGLLELFLLLFADDIVLLSLTANGLQKQIDLLCKICRDLCLNINTDKTKVMVFRKGGFLGKHEKWNLEGNKLEVVNQYNYLGFLFTTKMSFVKGTSLLVGKGKKACFGCIKSLCQLPGMTKECYFHMFDTQVQSILLYAAEIWGISRLENIEKIHTMAIKRYLKVPSKMPNKFVYGEVGRHPLYVNSFVKCAKYWLRLLRLEVNRLPKQAYNMLLSMDIKGKHCWVSELRVRLFELGFGYAWVQQGVGCERSFISILKQRLKDNFLQEWESSVYQKDMYARYRSFKSMFQAELYFKWLDITCFRDGVIKLRMGTLPIKGASFRNMFETKKDIMCLFCNEIEHERHFVCDCRLYTEVRQKYLGQFLTGDNSYSKLLKCNSEFMCRRLGIYIFHAIKIRYRVYQ